MAIHLIIVPLLTFSGSLGSMIKALAMDSKDEVIASFSAAGNDGPNLDRTKINATRAKTVWKYMAWTKIKFLLNAFAMVTFTAFLLTLDNSPGVLMDLVLMSAYFTVICFATPVHFIYFPAGATFGQKPGDPEVIDYPSVPRLLVLHVLVMMIGWSIGNYVAMLDWDPPYMHFPNCNMLGLCAGHLLSGLLAVVAIRT
ncbi:carbamoyl phosphate synthase small subunit, putative [Babesia ovis]|uniref:Carbamoyl phosphate synthase small subunit, putative n=1 Tax=Babesia ovis TaxID=5869 RepID=A0A9W5WTU8_BABOV|nr:carbamoyl phosphate synthase small subunit, putative [Babesia ovis]